MLDVHGDLRQRLSEDRDGLLSRTRARLIRLARARGVPAGAADDIAQETLLEAWRTLDRLTSPDGFAPWVDGICRNICRRAARRNGRETSHFASPAIPAAGSDEDTMLIERLPDGADDPGNMVVEDMTRGDLVALLDQAMGALPSEARQMIALCHLRETPHTEVAAQLGIATGALDTRLSRARRRLLDVLHGPLRERAMALGLPLDEGRAGGWIETRLWCPLCAGQRLQGMFMAGEGADGGPNLHLRCPACARRWARDTFHTMGLVSLAGLRSFRPAWKRAMLGLSQYALDALRVGWRTCWRCGGRAGVEVAPDTSGAGPTPYYIRARCERCGEVEDTTGDLPALDHIVYWSHPATRAFLLGHDRVRTAFGDPVERDGAQALPLTLSDATSGARVTALADLTSLRVLALA